MPLTIQVIGSAADSYDDGMADITQLIDAEELARLPFRLCAAACIALECGDWMGDARLRTVQAIGLINAHLLWQPVPDSTVRFEKYSVCAVRICQELQLHTMVDDPSMTPQLDRVTSRLPQSLQRQLALRTLYLAATMDHMCHRHRASLPLNGQ